MIPVQNVYYMLSYAFKVLNEQGYKRIATEEFNNTAELMAAILDSDTFCQYCCHQLLKNLIILQS